MALKRQFDMTSLFSMASMTDVIFLLLIFFMVTSTFVFPTALEINLPQSSEQTAIKPTTRVYIDKDTVMYVSYGEMEPQAVAMDQLEKVLNGIHQQDTTIFVAIYADESINYGKLVEVLNLGANSGMKMVLATKPAPASAKPQN
ncbi:MAG: biopolymer transporter ExbD [Bacteroides sp.]|nr:biopolymer transporter ExbD [Bacteroides sp.]MDE7470927.1 biopolymer transporter ExbD [Paramuribaculum sp.]